MIRLATIADIPPIQQIARQFSQGLGFVRRGSLERAISKDELYVADVGGGLLSADPDCTLETALKRLEKRGVVGKKLISRGWFRFYEYYFIG